MTRGRGAFADVALLLANVVYATSYVVTRAVLESVPPATLALLRVALGAVILIALARRAGWTAPVRGADQARMAAMGVVGFAGAFALAHWGLERSTATNAALLIVVEPLTVLLLAPALLGERLSWRERIGAASALAGAALVVVNGVPGLSVRLVPYWRGDLLLVLSGVAYAAYTLLGRPVLARHPALPVTARSILWGIPVLVPPALAEWLGGRRPVWTAGALLGTLYLAVAITAFGYLVWNWALQHVPAAHAAIFLNVQPVLGALLGGALLGEPLTVFTLGGAALVAAGLALTVRSRASEAVYS